MARSMPEGNFLKISRQFKTWSHQAPDFVKSFSLLDAGTSTQRLDNGWRWLRLGKDRGLECREGSVRIPHDTLLPYVIPMSNICNSTDTFFRRIGRRSNLLLKWTTMRITLSAACVHSAWALWVKKLKAAAMKSSGTQTPFALQND